MPPLSALAVPAVLPRNCPVEIPGSRTKALEKRLQPFKPQYTLDKSRRMRSIADNTGADDANLFTAAKAKSPQQHILSRLVLCGLVKKSAVSIAGQNI